MKEFTRTASRFHTDRKDLHPGPKDFHPDIKDLHQEPERFHPDREASRFHMCQAFRPPTPNHIPSEPAPSRLSRVRTPTEWGF
jgi:hypothetical protein